MTMAASPSFAATPKTGIATISTINTNRDGTGTIVALFTPGASGSRASSVTITAIVTTTAQLVRLYRSLDSGSTWKLWKEVPIGAITVATGTAGATATVALTDATGQPVGLASTDRIGAAAETANSMVLVTEYADL